MANNQDFKTYAELEAYVDKLEQEQKPVASTMDGGQADMAGQLQQICKYYKIVKPILKLVLALPLIPEKIKKPIKDFMAILDTLCP